MYKNYYSFLLFLAVVLLTGKLSAQENRFENTGNAGIGTGAASPSHRLSIETADTTTANMIKLEHKALPIVTFS